MRRDELIAVADGVAVTMKTALAPVYERITGVERSVESHLSVIVRDMELVITKEIGAVRERVAALESRPPLPGPTGPPGRDGKDGEPGTPGTPGLRYLGVYTAGKGYDLGDIVTYAGAAWHCNGATDTRPGDGSAAWTLMVKRGRDAKGSH